MSTSETQILAPPVVLLRVFSGNGYYHPGISEQINPRHDHHSYSIAFSSRPLDMSADTAARHARFERTWKVIKQELLDYITGEDMPNDAI